MSGRISRVPGGEDGFTLAEVLVSMMVMMLVLFALYGVFDMSIRVFSVGNDKVEATENARLGLERMEREIRAAHPYDASDDSATNDHLFFDPRSPDTGAIPPKGRISFGNDLGVMGDGRLDCPDPKTCEFVTYKLASNADPDRTCKTDTAPCTLRRVKGNNPANRGDSVVEFVRAGGLTFTYLKSDGTPAQSEPEIATVQIRLQVEVDGRAQTLTTGVGLRNRGQAE